MQFNIPTTKTEMYVVLNDLFYYYRIRREGYEEANLQELQLQRLSISQKTDEELLEEATLLLKSKHEREKKEYENKLNSSITECQQKLSNIEENYIKTIEEVNLTYEVSAKKFAKDQYNAGLLNSTFVATQNAIFEENKNAKIVALTQEKNNQTASLSAQLTALNQELAGVEEYFSQIHQFEIYAKVNELASQREQERINAFKYNNGLDEKEQRYSNTIKESKMSLWLRYLDISSGEFTKDQLTDMGYYRDVITCVGGYYDTLEPLQAYRDIVAEKELAIYLDHYYQNVIYNYKVLAE